MSFPVFLDTCTIYGAGLNDLLLTLAEQGTYRPLWSEDVMRELRYALRRSGIDEAAIDHRVNAMNDAFPDASVSGYQGLIPQMPCDEQDQHVMAAAVRSSAATIVTFNLQHFPPDSMREYDLEVVHPDDFLLDQLDLCQATVIEAVIQVPTAYENPPVSVNEFLDLLRRSNVPKFVKALRILV